MHNPHQHWVVLHISNYMLVDPLGPHPIVVTGSANFSEATGDANGTLTFTSSTGDT